ncbi:lytic transglycosylase domain-containing protein [Nocardiopsis sp. NPDC006198]|uniref:lytic transglycosylase domain-containing protein n=1 Tax=Nocardiopsis sp. NPDC006198 TaxID=3154472 RepID=UPI0033B053EB
MIAGLIALVVALPLLIFTLLTSGNENNQGLPDSVEGIHDTLLQAYGQAASSTPDIRPDCSGMRWTILAGIGQIESNHAAGSSISNTGDTDPRVIGPRLDGSGAGGNTVAFPDSDGGQWDGDTDYDRAVGPMQFIPTSWEAYGQDGNGDGIEDPHNVFDATLAAAAHLCGSGTRDLSDREELRSALFSYNRSTSYVEDVLREIDAYDAMSVVFVGDGNISYQASDIAATGKSHNCGPMGTTTQLTCLGHQTIITHFPNVSWGEHCDRASADDHGAGRACDFMTAPNTPDGNANGDALAMWAIANHEQLGIDYVIWRQSIWNPGWTACTRADRTPQWYNNVPDMPGGKWCGMEDRGDLTQNHYDHVHISWTH